MIPHGRLFERLRARFAAPSDDDAQARLRATYAAFRRLVGANTAALELMADMQDKAAGEYLFDRAYVDRSLDELLRLADGVVRDLGEMSGRRIRPLESALARVARATRDTAGPAAQAPTGPAVLDLASAGGAPIELVGGKIRRLGEIGAAVGLPVPDGFCVTTAACALLLQQGDLLRAVRAEVDALSLRDKEELNRASRTIRERVRGIRWPEALAGAVLGAFDALERRAGAGLKVSVRSSAVGEDGEFSFAGQFDSVLNVGREALLPACLEVLGSLFGPRALVYLKARGAEETVPPMAIGVIAMVNARTSGVLYTRDPQEPAADLLTVAGVWGLGTPAVDGTTRPDIYTLAGRPEASVRSSTVHRKGRMLLSREDQGLVEVDVPEWMQDQPCLTKDQLRQLGAMGARLEAHFGRPQDVEWALDLKDNLFVLQSRPLRLAVVPDAAPGVAQLRQNLTPLLRQGVVACRGCAAGRVWLLASEEDVHLVPLGAVLVARSASPRLAEAVDRAAAIVTDEGSHASHLATVAREFGIPAILGTGSGSAVLKPGMLVTVDGEWGNVYEGRVEALLAGTRKTRPADEETPLLKRFRQGLDHVVPLHLTDPRSPSFRPSRCRTVHDILRYAHEAAVQEMFRAGGRASRGVRLAARLESDLPVAFFFVDLGGGLRTGRRGERVTPADFACRPLLPLWRGMTGVPWARAAAAGAGGMASVISSAMTARESLREAAEPNLVIVAEAYLNLSFRLGYHFSRVDAYLGDRPEENYATFLFQGGAGDAAGRSRRVRFIAALLEPAGFRVHARRDALVARTGLAGATEMARRLALLGQVMVATRQVDTLFRDDASVERALAAFRAGDFTLGFGGVEEVP